MKATKLCSILLAALTIVALSKQADAQYTDTMGRQWTTSMGGVFNNPISAQISSMAWNRIFSQTAMRSVSDRAATATAKAPSATTGTAASPAPAENKTGDPGLLRFRSTGTHISTPKLAEQLASTPAEREQYLKLMNAVLEAFDQHVKEAGLQNDLAIAMSYFLAENARIYRGLPDLSDQQFVNLRNVIADAFLSTGALNNITDRQKQEFYEGLVAYTGITQFGYEQSKQANNDQMAKSYQKVAGQNLQTVTRMSPDSIKFGPDGLSATGDNSSLSSASTSATGGGPIDIYQLRKDYSENELRADQLYKGKRFIFTGTVVEVSAVYYKSTGQDVTGRYLYTDVGANLKVTNSGGGTVIGWDVHCFFRDNRQLAQLRGQQKVTFEATVEGRQRGGTNIILVEGVLR
jgi:uncharacterized protein DUF6683/putative nucleic acid binding protein